VKRKKENNICERIEWAYYEKKNRMALFSNNIVASLTFRKLSEKKKKNLQKPN